MKHLQDTGTKGGRGWTLPLAPGTPVSELIKMKAQAAKVASSKPFILQMTHLKSRKGQQFAQHHTAMDQLNKLWSLEA